MKKITIFIFLMSNLVMIGQQYAIQIRLVDAEIGYPTGSPYNNYPPVSNDAGLNDIFDTFGATSYIPSGNGVPDWNDRTHQVSCNGCDINQFEQALDSYFSVVERADQTEPGFLANGLYVKLVDLNNGNNTGNTTPDGIIITNNTTLNSIFVDFVVLHFEQAYPSSQNPELLKFFSLGCDCLGSDLIPVLEAETDIVESVGPLDFAVLHTEDFGKFDIQFYPSPVDNNVIIASSENIISYEVVNLLGQSIFIANNKERLNEFLPSLPAGTYLCKLVTEFGKRQTVRFIKK